VHTQNENLKQKNLNNSYKIQQPRAATLTHQYPEIKDYGSGLELKAVYRTKPEFGGDDNTPSGSVTSTAQDEITLSILLSTRA
jgi:hypothetical protein